MPLASSQFQIPSELSDLILHQECIAFVGSGASGRCYHSWDALVNALCERCNSPVRVEPRRPAEEYLSAAQDAKTSDEDAYFEYLGEHFGRADETNRLYDALLSLPFDCYLTVNFDPLLALGSRTARIECDPHPRAYPALDRRDVRGRTIHYLHGYIAEGAKPRPGTIVLSRCEFEEAYHESSPLMHMLVPTLENDPIVFVGCRLREPVMQRVVAICKQHQQRRMRLAMECGQINNRPPSRYILLPRPEVRDSRGRLDREESEREIEVENAYYKELEIIPVWYPAPGGDHSRLRHALEELAGLPKMEASYGWGVFENGE